jgi:hypothetical protein
VPRVSTVLPVRQLAIAAALHLPGNFSVHSSSMCMTGAAHREAVAAASAAAVGAAACGGPEEVAATAGMVATLTRLSHQESRLASRHCLSYRKSDDYARGANWLTGNKINRSSGVVILLSYRQQCLAAFPFYSLRTLADQSSRNRSAFSDIRYDVRGFSMNGELRLAARTDDSQKDRRERTDIWTGR